MSTIIPPMVSSSPPPMDDNIEDEDDEFGDFAEADQSSHLEEVTNLSTSTAWKETTQITHCNVTHVSSNTKDHIFKNEDTLINTTKHHGLCNGNTKIIVHDPATTDEDEEELEYGVFEKERRELETGSRQQDNTSQDSVVSGATDSGLCSASQNSDGASPVMQGDDRFSPICQDLDHEGSSGSDETLVKSVDLDMENKRTMNRADLDSDGVLGGECSQISVASSMSEEVEHPVFEEMVDNKVFDDFTDFQSDNQLRTNSVDADVNQFNKITLTSSNEGICVSDSENTISSFESSKHSSQNEFSSLNFKPSSFSRLNDGRPTEERAIDQKEKDECLGTVDTGDESFTATQFDMWDTNACEQSGDREIFSSSIESQNGVHKPTKLFPESNETSDNWAESSVMELPTTLSLDEIDNDFYDFESAEFHTAASEQRTDISSLSSKVEVVMTTLFPGSPDNNVGPTPLQPLIEHLSETSGVWGHLQDMETSHALSYQWASSATNNMMLTALGIDSRNILFGPRWNASVPRFASNLGFIPLEPVRASGSTFQGTLPSKEEPTLTSYSKPEPTSSIKSQDLVPAAQFDWNGSGLVNPLDLLGQDLPAPTSSSQGSGETSFPILMPIRPDSIIEQILTAGHFSLVSHPTRSSYDKLGKESIKIIGGLPDLSFVRAKMLMFPVRCASPASFLKEGSSDQSSG